MVEKSMRMQEAINSLRKWQSQLEQIIPNSYEEYENDFVVSSACERISEKIIEEIITISNMVLREKGISKREKCFEILSDLNIISRELSRKLENLKGMRNLMIHNYGDFDEELFYESLKEILEDSYIFLQNISNNLKF